MKENVSKAGYSISVGYAMRDKTVDLEETIRESDKRMYEDKADYYRKGRHDRRNGRGGAERA